MVVLGGWRFLISEVPLYTLIDSGFGEGHKTRGFRRVTYPEWYITKYTTYTKTKVARAGRRLLLLFFITLKPRVE